MTVKKAEIIESFIALASLVVLCVKILTQFALIGTENFGTLISLISYALVISYAALSITELGNQRRPIWAILVFISFLLVNIVFPHF